MAAILHQPKAGLSASVERLIAIKDSSVTCQWAGRGGEM